MRTILSLFLVLAVALPASSQRVRVIEDDSWCDESKNYNRNQEKFCEVREISIPADRRTIYIDAGQNGGVSVEGWNKDEIFIRARVLTGARTKRKAKELADKTSIETRSAIEADYPGKNGGNWGKKEWVSVSYEIYAPKQSNIDVETFNGGVSLEDLEGDIEFEALNGGVSLTNLSGDVRGHTTNGGLKINLAGDEWDGDGLDVSTTNGGVVVSMDEDYSATLEVGTVNGSLELDFPVTVRGKLDNNIKVTLGDGGQRIRAKTTNGSVRVKHL